MGVFIKTHKLKNGRVVKKRAIRWYVWEGERDENNNKIFKTKSATLGDASKITISKARKVLNKIKEDIEKKNNPDEYGESPTLWEYANEFIEDKKIEGKAVWKHYSYDLKPLIKFFGKDKLLETITVQEIKQYKRERAQEVQNGTCNRELQFLRHMINTAIKDKDIRLIENPVSRAGLLEEVRKERDILKIEEWLTLYEALFPPVKRICFNNLLTGMRPKETINLLESDLRLDAGYIFLGATKSKGKNFRRIAVDEMAIDNIKEAIEFRDSFENADTEYIFVNSKGRKYAGTNSVYETMVRTAHRIGMRHVFPYLLRHTFATWALNDGGHIVGIQSQLGHTNVKTTMIYAQPEEIVKEAQTLISKKLKLSEKKSKKEDETEEDKLIIGF